MSVQESTNTSVKYEWNEKYWIHSYRLSNKFCFTEKRFNFWLKGCWQEEQTFELTIFKNDRQSANAVIEVHVQQKKTVLTVKDWLEYYELPKFIVGYNTGYYSHQRERNSLAINVVFTIQEFEYISPLPLVFNFYEKLKNYFMTDELKDFVIVVDDKELPVHKLVLASQSPVIAKMFKSDMKEASEDRMVIEGIPFDIMKKVLEVLYTGKLQTNEGWEVVLEVLVVADKYEMETTKSLCELSLSKNITILNVLNICEYANLCNSLKLVKKTKEFMLNNRKDLSTQEKFKTLYEKSPSLLYDFFMDIIAMT